MSITAAAAQLGAGLLHPPPDPPVGPDPGPPHTGEPLLHPTDLEAVPVTGPRRFWGGPLDVEGLAVGSVTLAAAALQRLCGPARLCVAAERVAASFDSSRLLRVDGHPVPSFAPLSPFWPAADGWLRTHANYPHHRTALLNALGLDDTHTAPADVGARLRRLTAAEAEHLILAHGGIAAAVRTRTAWTASAEGVAAAALTPLTAVPDAGEAAGAPRWVPPRDVGHHPLTGLRVVELTRVIAGPTATRTLAALGADVTRIDPPASPELPGQHLDTDAGKRMLALDLREEAERVHRLLSRAHVILTGFRPGALVPHGLEGPELAARHPHLIRARLSAWGSGPRHDRRGFDSIVQAATGISALYRDLDEVPGALPVQALDHATGQLLVAGIAALVHRRAQGGGGGDVEAALAGSAEALFALPLPAGPREDLEPAEPQRWEPGEVDGPEARILAAPAALAVDGEPARPPRWRPPPPK